MVYLLGKDSYNFFFCQNLLNKICGYAPLGSNGMRSTITTRRHTHMCQRRCSKSAMASVQRAGSSEPVRVAGSKAAITVVATHFTSPVEEL